MPTYEYECESCGHHFEVFQSMSARKLSKCPENDCTGKVRRLLGTGAGLIFKGSGFYETDYRSDSYKEAAKKDKSSAETSSSDSSGSEKSSKKTESSGSKKKAEKSNSSSSTTSKE